MNQTQFNEIYQNELTPPQKKVLSGFLAGKKDQEILDIIESSDRTAIIRHIKNICKKFDIQESDDWRDDLRQLFMQYRPDLVGINDLPLPGCVEPLKSPYYIERNNCESRCYQEITKPGSLIRIKGPKQMGKTSLIKRIIREAENQKYHVVELNLSQIDTNQLTNIDIFLRAFYADFKDNLKSKFELPSNLEEWDKDLPSKRHCTNQIENILKKLETNLVLILDEVDILFPFPNIYQDFFSHVKILV
ncbi:MAG TPA: AAA-like domain-containing protein [Allocoleopsis sp.]